MDSEQFDYNGCIQWLDVCINSYDKTKDFPIAELGRFLKEFCKVFKQMGKLLSLAFSDVDDKVNIIMKICELYQGECGGMLLATVNKEVSLNIAKLNGENNKKETKDPQYAKYDSLSRNLLRMMWFQNFLKVMFEELIYHRDQKSSKAFHKAYDFAFSKHHTFIIKTGASLAMSAAPSKDKIKQYLLGPAGGSDEDFYRIMTAIYERIDKVKTIQWNYFEANHLTELP